MTCSNCDQQMAEHCTIHLTPCCPGKCNGETGIAPALLVSGGPAEVGHIVGMCHSGRFHPYRAV